MCVLACRKLQTHEYSRGNSSLVLVGTCSWEFKIRPIGGLHIPTFHEKVIHSNTNQLDLRRSFDQNYPNFAQILEKKLKIDSFIYQILHKIRGHSYIRRLILLPMFTARPHIGYFVLTQRTHQPLNTHTPTQPHTVAFS